MRIKKIYSPLRRNIYTIISRINLIKLSLSSKDLKLPFNLNINNKSSIKINKDIIDSLLDSNENNENISKLMMYM